MHLDSLLALSQVTVQMQVSSNRNYTFKNKINYKNNGLGPIHTITSKNKFPTMHCFPMQCSHMQSVIYYNSDYFSCPVGTLILHGSIHGVQSFSQKENIKPFKNISAQAVLLFLSLRRFIKLTPCQSCAHFLNLVIPGKPARSFHEFQKTFVLLLLVVWRQVQAKKKKKSPTRDQEIQVCFQVVSSNVQTHTRINLSTAGSLLLFPPSQARLGSINIICIGPDLAVFPVEHQHKTRRFAWSRSLYTCLVIQQAMPYLGALKIAGELQLHCLLLLSWSIITTGLSRTEIHFIAEENLLVSNGKTHTQRLLTCLTAMNFHERTQSYTCAT